MDRNELKVQALLERVRDLENTDSERRVDITLLTYKVQELEGQLAEAHEQISLLEENDVPEEVVIEADSK